MEQFQLLKVSFGEKVIIDTYDQTHIDDLVEELKKHYQTDRIFTETMQSGWTSISTKKKDNLRINRQLVLHLLGSNGWEPFYVEPESNCYYFRNRTSAKSAT